MELGCFHVDFETWSWGEGVQVRVALGSER